MARYRWPTSKQLNVDDLCDDNKSDSGDRDGDDEVSIKTPTNKEMLSALNVLRAGV